MVIDDKCGDVKKDIFVKEFQKKIDEKTEQRDRVNDQLNKDIAALNAVVSSVEPSLESYDKIRKDLENSKKEQDDYSKKKTPMINSAIGTKKATVEKIIKTYDDKITNLEKEIAILKDKDIPEAQKQFEESEKKYIKEGKDPYKKCKDQIVIFEKSIKEKLEKLDRLKTEIEEIEQENNDSIIPMMYFLIKEFNDTLNRTSIINAADLALQLYDKWKVCDNFRKDKEEKSETLKEIKNISESKQRILDNLIKNRETELSDLIGKETWEKS